MKVRVAYHHVHTEQTFLFLQVLFDTSRGELPLSHLSRIFATINEAVDIDLELNQRLEKSPQHCSSSYFVNGRAR